MTGCYEENRHWGKLFWTAGQRTDPSHTPNSTFIWRVTSTNPGSETVYPMTYSRWVEKEPSYGQIQSCVCLARNRNYKWDNYQCYIAVCSVCEIDI